jgi:hypothetical protein
MPARRSHRSSGHHRLSGARRVDEAVDAGEPAPGSVTTAPSRPGPGSGPSIRVPDRRPSRVQREFALDNLRFIRETLERAGPFTAVPGVGLVVIGLTALGAAVVAGRQATIEGWILVWMAEAALSGLIGVFAIARKARASGLGLLTGPNRRFAFSFAPPMFAGALLTYALYASEQVSLLPGLWLVLFGAGVMSGGALSVRIIPFMGASFIALGAVALLASPALDDAFMAFGFGVLLIGFGVVIARRYGG